MIYPKYCPTCPERLHCESNDYDYCTMKVVHFDTHVKEFTNPDPEKYEVVILKGFSMGLCRTWYKENDLMTHWLVEKEKRTNAGGETVQRIVCNNAGNTVDFSFRIGHIQPSPFHNNHQRIELEERLFVI